MYGYNSYHDVEVPNQHDINGNPIYETCTVTHDLSRVSRGCPNGHGIKWTDVWHVEWHSGSYCTHYQGHWGVTPVY